MAIENVKEVCLTFKELHIALVADPTLFILEVFKGSLVVGADAADDFAAAPTMVSPPSYPKQHVAELQHRNQIVRDWFNTWQAATLSSGIQTGAMSPRPISDFGLIPAKVFRFSS